MTTIEFERPPGVSHRSDEPYATVPALGPEPQTEEESAVAAPESAPERARRGRRISAADVFAAADALLVEGHRPSIDRVRVRLGRGSPNTINEHLDTWWRQLGARLRDLPGQEFPQLPERVGETLQLLWNEALKGAHEALQGAMAARDEAVRQREEALAARERELEEARQALTARGSALEESLALARVQLAEANQRAAALEQALRERDEALGHAHRRLEQLESRATMLDERVQAEREARRTERASFDERYDAAERRWLTEVDQARERLKAADKQTRIDGAERNRLQEELQRATREALERTHELKTALAVSEQLRERIKGLTEQPPASAARRQKSRRARRTSVARRRKDKTE